MDTLLQDIRYALRSLRNNPGLTSVAAVTLGLGIGACTVIFSCMYALMFRPFPYHQPDRLVAIEQENLARGFTGVDVSYPNMMTVAEESRTLTGVAVFHGNSYNLAATVGEPERMEGGVITHGTFEVLGLAPIIGRTFTAEDDRPDGPRAVMLNERLWRERYRSDPSVLGTTLLLDGDPYTIVGVMPEAVQFPVRSQLWTPLAMDRDRNRGNMSLAAIARLRDGVTRQDADAELIAISRRMEAEYPETNAGWSARAITLHQKETGDFHSVMYIMLGAVGFVLLIACANVANILLARATSRHREIAIRTALGAGRVRILRQLLTESVSIALVGAALGILVAYWGLDLVVAATPADHPYWMVFAIDVPALIFTIVVAVSAGILFGIAPALQASRPDLQHSLKEGGRGSGAGVGRQRMRNGLVVAEVALSVVLLIGAALMVQSFLRLQQAEPGFRPEGVLTLRVALTGSAYDSTAARRAFYRDALTEIAAIPGVRSVAAINAIPLGGSNASSGFVVEDQPVDRGQEPSAEWRTVHGDYFGTMRIPLLTGRAFTRQEVEEGGRVVVVNRTLADRMWSGGDPIGRRLALINDAGENRWRTVIGVVEDVKMRALDQPSPMQLYVPHGESPVRGMSFVVRSGNDAATLARPAREAVHRVSAIMPVYSVVPLEELVRHAMWTQRLYGGLFAAFGAIALTLAAVGLYSVIAYMVAQRTREIGIRMALGAEAGMVQRFVVRQGVVLTGMGIVIGVIASLALMQVLSGMLYGVSAREPLSYIGVPLILAAVAVLASWVPARRATRVDPLTALRYE